MPHRLIPDQESHVDAHMYIFGLVGASATRSLSWSTGVFLRMLSIVERAISIALVCN